MRSLVQKLPPAENNSFIARTFRTPEFEVGWHQHIEHELILFTEGSGLSFVGDYYGTFDRGDVYLLGSNLPHTFQKRRAGEMVSAIVVRFREDFWGKEFMQLPESRFIRNLLKACRLGIKIGDGTKFRLAPIIEELEHASGFRRLLLLGECLELIAGKKTFTALSSQEIKTESLTDTVCIDRILRFTVDSFKGPVSLNEVAGIACMSVSAFCKYFKCCTKKTYFNFLNEIRIGNACTLLQDTQLSLLDICYDSGYKTMASFHRQFLRIKGITPLQYRKKFAGKLSLPQYYIGVIEEWGF